MNFSNNKAIYLQIADDINDRILTRRLKPEERIPSTRDLSAQYQVNINTIMRTVEYLQSKNIIFNKRGIGYFVTATAPDTIINLKSENFMNNELNYFFRQLYLIGIEPAQLAQLYSVYMASQTEQNSTQSNQ